MRDELDDMIATERYLFDGPEDYEKPRPPCPRLGEEGICDIDGEVCEKLVEDKGEQ